MGQDKKGTITKNTIIKPVDVNKRPKSQVVNISLDQDIKMKLPKREDMVVMKRPNYYMNNRQIFSQFINQIFSKYRDELNKVNNEFTCDSKLFFLTHNTSDSFKVFLII